MTLPTLFSSRLSLRWLHSNDADVDAVYRIFSNPVSLRYWSHVPFVERQRAVSYIDEIHAGFASGTLFQWGIERNADRALIGTVTLVGIDQINQRCSLGYILDEPYWRQGYAATAVNLALCYAFGELDLHRVEADIDPRNGASRRLLERLGFQREGLQRERYRLYDEWQDDEIYGLLSSDPAARKLLADP